MKTYVNKVDKCKRFKVNRKETTMKFSNLKVCPFCGNTTYYTKSYTTGVTRFNYNFDGSEADNSGMYDNLVTREESGNVYCTNCHKRLGNLFSDSVSKQAVTMINKLRRLNNEFKGDEDK